MQDIAALRPLIDRLGDLKDSGRRCSDNFDCILHEPKRMESCSVGSG